MFLNEQWTIIIIIIIIIIIWAVDVLVRLHCSLKFYFLGS
jgi:hypothetical protein